MRMRNVNIHSREIFVEAERLLLYGLTRICTTARVNQECRHEL